MRTEFFAIVAEHVVAKTWVYVILGMLLSMMYKVTDSSMWAVVSELKIFRGKMW